MTKIGNLWTGGVAYVSLAVGAGLSVAGNLADTYRTRGAATDTLDKVMAAGWPMLVLLAIEMFVSPRWSDKRLFQVWRWVGCLSVGGMAMVVSWTHLHDLMGSRGQLPAVSFLGPLAIDGMAIMATGLILSTRTRARMSVDTPLSPVSTTDMSRYGYADDGHAAADCADTDSRDYDRVKTDTDKAYGRWADALPVSFDAADMPDPVATRPNGELDAWTAGYENALSELGKELADETERFVSTGHHLDIPVVSSTATDVQPRRMTMGSAPTEFVDMLNAWTSEPSMDAPSRADMIKLSAAWFGVHPRTIRRWLASLTGE